LLTAEAKRASDYYKSGYALLPLISADARPALKVLIRIYHDLLRQMERSRYEVFLQRASVPTAKKLWILGGGMAQVLWNRMTGAK
jgi:phytoene synthase